MPAGQFQVFQISTSVDMTVYLYGKNVLYFFYNITLAKKNKKILQWISDGTFHVYIELCKQGSRPISVQNLQMIYYNKALKMSPGITYFCRPYIQGGLHMESCER